MEAFLRRRREPLTEAQIRAVFFQLLQALRYMHSRQYVHRDLKPENVLLANVPRRVGGTLRVKIADLGLSKCLKHESPRPHTTYIATRWYRSPEILLHLNYSYPSDMWAVAVVMAEIISKGQPLFPGDNQTDMLTRIFQVCGHPSRVGWRRGVDALRMKGFSMASNNPTSLKSVIPNASTPVLQLLTDLLLLDPALRPSASQALDYPVFLSTISAHIHTDRKRSRTLEDSCMPTYNSTLTTDVPSPKWSHDSHAARATHVDNDFEDSVIQKFGLGPNVDGNKQNRTSPEVWRDNGDDDWAIPSNGKPSSIEHAAKRLHVHSTERLQPMVLVCAREPLQPHLQPHVSNVLPTPRGLRVNRLRKPAAHFDMRSHS